MTPEAARSMGFELTKSAVVEWMSKDASLSGLLEEIEATVSGDSEAGPLPKALIPHAMRGARDFFSEVSRELDVRAAALESTR